MELPAATERRILLTFLFIIITFAVIDTAKLLQEDADFIHLFVEGCLLFSTSLGAIYFWQRPYKKLRTKNRALSREVIAARHDAERWKNDASNLLVGLGAKIEVQFDQWCLSEAEKDVGLLLLKGFSHKEIAALRGTSEKTIRHQSASIYRKTDLDGRTQLSAFFLEDLLLPSVVNK